MLKKLYLSNGKCKKLLRFTKKGKKEEIGNYRPFANLCSASKIFERLILIRINEIKKDLNIDLTGENQHVFKKGRSTSTAALMMDAYNIENLTCQ